MTRWKLTIEYDGTNISGWQKQANAPSVQQILEQAVESFSGEVVKIHAAGRTDAGVHARAMVAHFDLVRPTEGAVIRDALNFYVRPNKVVVILVEQVAEDFHARFDALRRSYRYRMINRRSPLALMSDYAWHVSRPLDIELMQQAADILIGKHDFSTFRGQNCQANSPIRTLELLQVTRNEDEVMIEAAARSFLYHQVRNMAGTLKMVGTGHISLPDFKTRFEACDRARGGVTAPAHGLCFWSVTYPVLHNKKESDKK